MKKMQSIRIKALSLVMVLFILATGCFTGCNRSKETASTGKEKTTTTPETDPKKEPSSEDSPRKHQLTILGKDRRYDVAPMSDRDEFYSWQALEEILEENDIALDFELVPKEQYSTVIQTRLAASSDLPDIVNLVDLSDQAVLDLGYQGATLVDLKPLIDQYSNGNTLAFWEKHAPQTESYLTTPEGNIFWYPSFAIKIIDGEPYNGTGFSLQYRQDWLESTKQEAPSTTTDLLEMLRTFQKNDANENGVADEVAAVAVDTFNNGIAQLFGLAPEFIQIENKTSTAVSPWLQPGIRPYLQFMQTLVADGLYDASLVGAGWEVVDQKIHEDKASLICSYNEQFWYEEAIGKENALYVPFLVENEEGIEPSYRREDGALIYQKYGVTQNCDDVEGAVKLFDIIYSEEYAELSMYGVEGKTFEWQDGRKVFLHPDWNDEQLAEARISVGNHLYGHQVLPVVNLMEEWTETVLETIPAPKVEFDRAMNDFDNDYISINVAIPTTEERELIDKNLPVLETYSSELLVNIILGNTPLDALDSSIEEMKAMGLEDLLSVHQERHQRLLSQ